MVRSEEGIILNQRNYALELITDSGMLESKEATTPMEQQSKLTIVDFDEQFGSNRTDSLLQNLEQYRRTIGRLLYLTMF